MKIFVIGCIVVFFSGCGANEMKEKCTETVQYFCFYNQTYKVTSCDEDVKSEIVIEGASAKSCISEVVYSEIDKLQ